MPQELQFESHLKKKSALLMLTIITRHRECPSLQWFVFASKIIYLYHEECREHCVEPLNEHTCFRLLEVCSTSKQKSLQGLDSTSTTGEEAYEATASIVENVG